MSLHAERSAGGVEYLVDNTDFGIVFAAYGFVGMHAAVSPTLIIP